MPLLQWARSMGYSAQPVGIGPSPLGTFGPKPKTGDSPLPFPAWWLTRDSCRPGKEVPGASPEPTDPIEIDWVERGSPRQPTDDEEDGSGEVVVGSADERWPEWDFGPKEDGERLSMVSSCRGR
jgi:hypothetical protein